MRFPSLRYALSKSYFPIAFLIAIVLTILDLTIASVHGQVRTATVTVYVTVVQTVPVIVPVTAYVTVASVATSFMTLTTTAVSLGTVTLWNTVSLWNTVTTAAAGILGPMPANIFGQYSDVALAGGGVLGGVAVGLVSGLIMAKGRYARLNESLVELARVTANLKDLIFPEGIADLASRSVWKRLHPELGFDTNFEDFSQKVNQLYKILEQVLRFEEEMHQKQARDFL